MRREEPGPRCRTVGVGRRLPAAVAALAWVVILTGGCFEGGDTDGPPEPPIEPADAGKPVGTSPAASLRTRLASFMSATLPRVSSPALADARRWLQAGRMDDARAELERIAAAGGPRAVRGEAAFLLGSLHHRDERWQLALPWFARALECGPVFPNADQLFYQYARCLLETGDLEGARAGYEADLALSPDSGDALYRLALIDFEAGALDACERRARSALERFERPRDLAKADGLLGDVLLARDDPVRAREAYERCVGRFPHYEVLYKLSRVCARLGDAAAAARYLEEHRLWRARAGR